MLRSMNRKETNYQSPAAEVTDICATGIICASGDNVTVSDPWSGNVEQEW